MRSKLGRAVLKDAHRKQRNKIMMEFLGYFKDEFLTMGYTLPMVYVLSLVVGLNVEGGNILLIMLGIMLSLHTTISLVNVIREWYI